MRLRAAVLLAALAVLPVASASAAGTADYAKVLRDIQNDGHLDPCAYTNAELARALAEEPPDVARHAPDIKREIQAGMAARSQGQCAGAGSSAPENEGDQPAPGATTTPAPGATTTPAPGTTATPAPGAVAPGTTTSTTPATTTPGATPTVPTAQAGTPAPARHDADTRIAWLPLVVLGAIALVALLFVGLLALFRALGREPGWAGPARHAWAEAGYRAGATWEDFLDWLRLGR